MIDTMDWGRLFADPYRTKIQHGLPLLFDRVQREHTRGGKVGMEVGNSREKVLIALFIHAYGMDSVRLPSTVSPEEDAVVCGRSISIKTKTGQHLSGLKLMWGSDQKHAKMFIKQYVPKSDILFVQVNWGGQGGFYRFAMESQIQVLKQLGRSKYFKLPKSGTNPRGVALAAEAVKLLQSSQQTLCIPIQWEKNDAPVGVQELYGKWVKMWENVA